MDYEVVQAIKEMNDDGFFDTLDSEKRGPFQQNLQRTFEDRDNQTWKVTRCGKIIEESGEIEDFYLMTGWLASCVLTKNEIWNHQKFGFESLEDFLGSFGAAIWEASHGELRGGYEWVSKIPKGRIIKNNISGAHNLDLRIFQTDITPDVTVDPAGSQVSYRPELDADTMRVSPYHSTEPAFLTGVLKWINQEGIHSEVLVDKGKSLIKYTTELGHKVGAATECLGMDHFRPSLVLGSFDIPIPVLNDNYETSERTIDALYTNEEVWACMYVGPNKELVFSYQSEQDNPKKKLAAIFQPEDADHLLKGIFYQAANGLGRTVPQSLISMIEYRFSGQMEKDIEEIRKSLAH